MLKLGAGCGTRLFTKTAFQHLGHLAHSLITPTSQKQSRVLFFRRCGAGAVFTYCVLRYTVTVAMDI